LCGTFGGKLESWDFLSHNPGFDLLVCQPESHILP
jgi:hypothetical protein